MELSKFIEKYSQREAGKPWIGANGLYVITPSCPTNFWGGEKCDRKIPKQVKCMSMKEEVFTRKKVERWFP